MLNNLLLYRFILFNVLCLGLMAVLHSRGTVMPLFAQDTTFISHGIVAVFLVGWVTTWRLAWRTSRQINAFKQDAGLAQRVTDPYATPEDRTKALGKMEWLHKMPEWMAILGLLGTVIGFSMALSGIGDASVSNAAGIKSLLGTMLAGMRIAINTTIIGVVCGLWTEINVRMLLTASGSYWSDRIARGR